MNARVAQWQRQGAQDAPGVGSTQVRVLPLALLTPALWARSYSPEERLFRKQEVPSSNLGGSISSHGGEAQSEVSRPHKPGVVGSSPTPAISCSLRSLGVARKHCGFSTRRRGFKSRREHCGSVVQWQNLGLSLRGLGFNSRRSRGLVAQSGQSATPRRWKSRVRIASSPCIRSLTDKSTRLLSGKMRVQLSSDACPRRLIGHGTSLRSWNDCGFKSHRGRMAEWLSVDGAGLRSPYEETAQVQILPPLQPDSVTASTGTLQVLSGGATPSRATYPHLAQSVEQRAVNPYVAGSTPAVGTRLSVSGRLPDCHSGDSGSIPGGRI